MDPLAVDQSQLKLANAAVYFVQNTKHCHTLKLFKLLNFLDMEHYRQTGRAITGLVYKALKNGPVPTTLYKQLEDPNSDLRKFIIVNHVHDDLDGTLRFRDIKVLRKFDHRFFTRRELVIMERLAEFFLELKAHDMSEFSHDRRLPWVRVYKGGKGDGEEIPLDLALTSTPLVKEEGTIPPDELEFLRHSQLSESA